MLSIVRSRNEPAVVELDTSQATFPMMLTPTGRLEQTRCLPADDGHGTPGGFRWSLTRR